MNEMVGGCCVCSDERGWPDNPLVYCDGTGCTVAVHQACYGIVAVPSGPWFCRKCETLDKPAKVRCDLCPSGAGALKRTDNNGWAHVVCALYIPEVRFGNVTSMEPIILQLIPQERFSKTCYICQESGKPSKATNGACMQCNKAGCKQQFHVTCAQSLGLLCEEAGNYIDNVKYCGYCQHHYSKLKKGGNVKTIPPYKPITHDGQSSDSSGEKEGEGSPLRQIGSPLSKSSIKGQTTNKKTVHGNVTPKSSSGLTKTTSSTSTGKPQSTDRFGKKSPQESQKIKTPEHTSNSMKATPPNTLIVNQTEHSPKSTNTSPSPKNTQASTIETGSIAKTTQDAIGVINSNVSRSTSTIVATSQSSISPISLNTSKYTTSLQESVIANNDYMDAKQTKKRKAITQANLAAASDYINSASAPSTSQGNDVNANMWESGNNTNFQEQIMESAEIKKPKTEPVTTAASVIGGAFAEVAQYSQNTNNHMIQHPLRSPRLPSSEQQTSNTNSPGSIPLGRSPSNNQLKSQGEGESLLVSVPLPSAALNFSAHNQSAGNTTESQSHSNWQPSLSYDQHSNSMQLEHHADKGLSMMCASNSLRTKKRTAVNETMSPTTIPQTTLPGSASQHSLQPPVTMTIKRTPRLPTTVFPENIKTSPPSSPGSERKHKNTQLTSPQMLGNELNPESSAAIRLSEYLTAESTGLQGSSQRSSHLLPPLINKATSGRSSTTGGSSNTSSAQSLDQLLERQWEQGSQFLMEQAQHFDIASLLSCLHQLRTENVRLEEHVAGLQQRRDHLLAVNARLAIPLTTVPTGPPEPPRPTRENNGQMNW